MKGKSSDPLWTVRGVSRDCDVCLVVQAPNQTAAECFAIKRGVEVVVIGESTPADIAQARVKQTIWRYSPEPRLKCFGRPIGYFQAAVLVILGLATIVLDLKANGVPLKLYW